MTSPQIIDCEQNSEEWYRARMGIPTASEFATVMARTPGGRADGKTRQIYMRKLAGEIITGEPMDKYTNHNFDRGHALEDEARDLYCFAHDVEPVRVGFIRDGDKGCSPDALIGEDGGLEIKVMFAHLLIEKLEADKFPTEHLAQVQGNIWVTRRKWWDLAIYCPGLPLFVKRATRDQDYVNKLAKDVSRFNAELGMLVDRIRRYGTRTFKEDVRASLAVGGPTENQFGDEGRPL